MIPIYKPYLPKHILKYPKKAIDSTWVSSSGYFKEKLIEAFKEYFGVPYVILVNNGTSAVHLLSKATQYFFPKIKKIIVPNNVYVAAWNGFLYDRYYKLIPVDSNVNTWNINLDYLYEEIKRDSNVIFLAVHNLGNIIPLHSILKRYPDLKIIEDNCEGIFGKHNNVWSGTLSFCSAHSFFGNKTITSGEGGALFTKNFNVYKYLKKVHGQGQTHDKYIHNVLGYNYRMTNIQAALLYGQLINIDEIIERKKGVFNRYRFLFDNCNFADIQEIEKETVHSNWMFGIKFKKNINIKRVMKILKEKGIDTRPMFYPMSCHAHLKEFSAVEDNSKHLSERCIILPSYPELRRTEIDYIFEILKTI